MRDPHQERHPPKPYYLLLAPLLSGVALGMTTRHDVDDMAYVDYGHEIKLIGGVMVGAIGTEGFGTGTMISSQWVLTAAHVVENVTSQTYITFNTDEDPNDTDDLPLSGLALVDMVAIHEFYDSSIGPAGGFDIALLHLNTPLEQYTPWRLATSASEVGKVGTALGFGLYGTGVDGFDQNNFDFTRRAGNNVVDATADHPVILDEFVARTIRDPATNEIIASFTQEQIASQYLLTDFDAPADAPDGPYPNPLGSADPLPMEFSVAPGDSGGPLLIDFGDGWRVAGINSFIHAPQPPFGDGTENGSYGDLSGYLRVSMFHDWIYDVTGIPEPATATVLVGLAGFLLRRRRVCLN